jgi:hypothetical protein
MVKVHGKKSKRQTLRRKYNIDKKCRSTKKKQVKMARKIKKAGFIPNKQKEPGIPNLFPYKQQMIEQLENKEKQDEETKKLAKKLRKQLKNQNQQEGEGEGDDVDEYMQTVNSKIIRYVFYNFITSYSRTDGNFIL